MPISEELRSLYNDAREGGMFVREFPAEEGFIAFVGSVEKLKVAGFDSEKRKKMDHIQCSLYMTPEGGATREEAVKKALSLHKQASAIPTA